MKSLALIMVMGLQAFGCVIISAPTKVEPTFTVAVRGFGDPAPRIPVGLVRVLDKEPYSKAAGVAMTDEKGIARFGPLVPGEYFVEVKKPFVASADVQVVDGPVFPPALGPTASGIELSWPYSMAYTLKILSVRHVAGQLDGAGNGLGPCSKGIDKEGRLP